LRCEIALSVTFRLYLKLERHEERDHCGESRQYLREVDNGLP